MIRNLSAAMVLEHNLMQSDEVFREEIVRSIRHSSATFSAVHKLTSLLCIDHFEGTNLFTYIIILDWYEQVCTVSLRRGIK